MPSMTAASTSPSSPCNPKASTSTSILFSILSSSLRSESGCAFKLLPKLLRRFSGDSAARDDAQFLCRDSSLPRRACRPRPDLRPRWPGAHAPAAAGVGGWPGVGGVCVHSPRVASLRFLHSRSLSVRVT